MALQPFFVIPLDLGTMATGNAASGYPVANLNRHKAIGLKWMTSGATNAWARGDMGTVQDIDFCALISTNALSSTTFRLRLGDNQGEVDGTADYDSGAQPIINPTITRSDGLYHSHWELPSVQTKRWWRIDIGSHSGNFEAAMLVLGRKREVSRFYDPDHESGVEDLGGANFTRHGVWDETPGMVARVKRFALNWITTAEWEEDLGPMVEELGTSGPVYCCFDPEETDYRQRRTYYGKFGKAPFARGKRKPGTFGAEFEIQSLI